MSFNVNDLVAQLHGFINTAVTYSVRLVIAIIILIVGFWLERRITKSFKKILEARSIDPSLESFLASFMNIALKIVVVIIVLTTAGIAMTSIIAILGAASLAIGMALSGTLQNVAGGVVILLFKPFKVGDYIQTSGSYEGRVLNIYIFTTRIKTPDNKIIYIPNSSLSSGVIINVNEENLRRIDCTFGISYGEDVARARKVLTDMLDNDNRVLKDPAPIVYLAELADSSVNLLVRFWVEPCNINAVKYELNERVYNEFGQHNLSFPFPQMDIHVSKES